MHPRKNTQTPSLLMLVLLLQVSQVTSWDVPSVGYVYTASVEEASPPQGAVQGVHVAVAGSQELRVTWMTPVDWSLGTFRPVCFYGAEGHAGYKVNGVPYSYTAGMFRYTLNTAVLDVSVLPCLASPQSAPCVKNVSYQCGDPKYGFSALFHTYLHSDTTVPSLPGPQFAVVGDMAVPHGLNTINSVAAHLVDPDIRNRNSSTVSSVQMVLHVGDITYADDTDRKGLNNSWVWVDYMNSLQKVAATVPYMTAPGNHEAQFDFAAYLNWLPMPHEGSESRSPFWFSMDYLGVHLLFFSTEHDFSPNSTQHRWIQQDLKRANENRARVPWVVVMGHRPLYCSSIAGYDRCFKEALLYRTYLEDLLYQFHVDVVIAGHIHHYERSYPVYKDKATQKDYLNPRAPVYIVNGAAGNPEPNDPTFVPNVEWRAWYNVTVKNGFLLMTPSASQLSFQYYFSDSNSVIDSFTITKD